MALVSWVAVVLLALALAAAIVLGTFFVRRILLQRDGGFDMCLRTGGADGWAGGWVFGIGRYDTDDLEWYRTFSLSIRPKMSFERDDLEVHNRRLPNADEAYELPSDHVIMNCTIDEREADVSMNDPAATAFLAWLEAAPPGQPIIT